MNSQIKGVKAGKIMKKMIVGLLCVMLGLGTVSGCGSSKPEPEQSQDETAAEDTEKEDDTQTDTQTDSQESDSETEQTEEQEEISGNSSQTEDEEQGESNEKDMAQDMTMSVLKEEAGAYDYTSLEELNPEPGTRVAVVVKNTKTAYWTAVKQGMEAAISAINEKMGYKGDEKVTLSFEGPSDDMDVEKQIDLIDTVLSENPEVLCIAAIDMQSCEAQLEMARENDIPVIMLDSAVDSGPVSAVCSTDNYGAGVEAAKRLAEAIEDQGEVAVMAHAASSKNSQEREKGFTEEMTNNHPNIKIVNISHENEDFTMTKMADAVFTLYPEVKGYFCTNEQASNAVLEAVETAGKDIKIVGFDSGKQQQAAVKNGKEVGFITQNPYGMGYATVVAGIRADLGLEIDSFINTSYQWIDSENLEDVAYSSFLYE